MRFLKVLAAGAVLAVSTPVLAQDAPLAPAEYVEVTGIHIAISPYRQRHAAAPDGVERLNQPA